MENNVAARGLRGHIAIVTGAESGIGAACAAALGQAGADLAVCYHDDAGAAARTCAAATAVGGRAIPIRCDVSDEDSVEGAFAAANAALGAPDLMVHSAGLNQSGVAVADMELARWRQLIGTDLTGAFLMNRGFIRGLRAAKRPGRVVNIGSIHADVVRAGAADYASAKAGLRNLTRTLALECAPLKININEIDPGMILTPMNARASADPVYRAGLERSIPWARAGQADEVAQLAVFLLSPAADYITGASFTIDGGLSLVLGQGA